MTQQELGDALGIPRPTMAGYEANREPDIKTLVRIAKYFHVSVDYLTGASNEEHLEEPPPAELNELCIQVKAPDNMQIFRAEITTGGASARFWIRPE